MKLTFTYFNFAWFSSLFKTLFFLSSEGQNDSTLPFYLVTPAKNTFNTF